MTIEQTWSKNIVMCANVAVCWAFDRLTHTFQMGFVLWTHVYVTASSKESIKIKYGSSTNWNNNKNSYGHFLSNSYKTTMPLCISTSSKLPMPRALLSGHNQHSSSSTKLQEKKLFTCYMLILLFYFQITFLISSTNYISSPCNTQFISTDTFVIKTFISLIFFFENLSQIWFACSVHLYHARCGHNSFDNKV